MTIDQHKHRGNFYESPAKLNELLEDIKAIKTGRFNII